MNIKKVIWNLKNPDLIDKQTLSITLHEASVLLSTLEQKEETEKDCAELMCKMEDNKLLGG